MEVLRGTPTAVRGLSQGPLFQTPLSRTLDVGGVCGGFCHGGLSHDGSFCYAEGPPKACCKPSAFWPLPDMAADTPSSARSLGHTGTRKDYGIMDVPIEEYITGEGEKSLCQPHMPTKKHWKKKDQHKQM